MENKVQSLESEVTSMKDQLKISFEEELAQISTEVVKSTVEVEVQTKDIPIGVEVHTPMTTTKEDVLNSNCSMKKFVMLGILSYRVIILKRTS